MYDSGDLFGKEITVKAFVKAWHTVFPFASPLLCSLIVMYC